MSERERRHDLYLWMNVVRIEAADMDTADTSARAVVPPHFRLVVSLSLMRDDFSFWVVAQGLHRLSAVWTDLP